MKYKVTYTKEVKWFATFLLKLLDRETRDLNSFEEVGDDINGNKKRDKILCNIVSKLFLQAASGPNTLHYHECQ